MTFLAERRTTYAFGRFTIDREDERLFDSFGPVRIGNKAFQVLLALIEQRGRLVTKDALMSSVWDGTIVTESALTSVIKELRRALGDDARTPRFIESVYGRGYRLLCQVVQAEDAPQAEPTHANAPAGPAMAPSLARFEVSTVPAGLPPAGGALAAAGPARSLAAGRRTAQRAFVALLVTSVLALMPTGPAFKVAPVVAEAPAVCAGCGK